MENKLVTIATFPDALKAQIVRGSLEAEGIPCFIADEHTITNQPYLTMAYGGVRLQVQARDTERAREIINTRETFSVLNEAPEHESGKCPNCHSVKIEQVNSSQKQSFLNFIRSLLAIRTEGEFARHYTCRTCGYNWILEP